MTFFWHWSARCDGVLVECRKKGVFGTVKPIARAHWPNDTQLPGRDLLAYFLEAEEGVRVEDAGVLLPHELVAALPETQARLLGLPPSVPHALVLKSEGRIDEPRFSLSTRWLENGLKPVVLSRTGAIARQGGKAYRLPSALLKIVEAVETFDASETSTRELRVAHWEPVQAAVEAATGLDIRPDNYLVDLKIYYATAMSLSVDLDADKGLIFDPVLFRRTPLSRRQTSMFEVDPLADPAASDDEDDNVEGLDTLADEADQLLPPELQRVFLRKRFDRDQRCRQSYPLLRNSYVVIEKNLRTALDVVKQKQAASEQERRAFVKNPRAAFAEALALDPDSPALKGIFVETQQYADRVTGIGLWQPKVLPWLPRTPNSWLPERIGFRIGGRTVEIAPESLEEIKAACEKAMAAGAPCFDFADAKDIPATPDTLDAIEALREDAAKIMAADAAGERADQPQGTTETDLGREQSNRFALEADDNLEELQYQLKLSARTQTADTAPPAHLIDPHRLFPHQRQGFDWMVRSWQSGRPGILLADDMGLGKTIQTLAFAAWLHVELERRGGPPRPPFLIVAPTALLRNWKAEHDIHLRDGGLGGIVELYGSAVGAYRVEGETGQDTKAGHAVLDKERLKAASVILTTYETLANYHISLAGIRFPLVVFDEIQKLKTPTTINTHAAKTLNADFVIGLTGTPVENNLTELWSIMDRLHPGLLKDLKSFCHRFRADDTGSLRELHDLLVSPPSNPVMLRRMKDTTDLGQALPPRIFQPLPRDMPDIQANAYGQCVWAAKQELGNADRGAMLRILHQMRGISLHPEPPMTVLGRPERYEDYINSSARLITTIEVLDQVRAKGEKALVYVELHDMQRVLADILRHRYDLPSMPMIINGQTPSARRQQLVNEFQNSPPGRFDVMILAPRAAGVGLNITAANHVIHLSRWWNPAVEDQCNDRAYRIGQDKEVFVYYPIARHPAFPDASFDVSLDRLLARKRKLSRSLLVPAETENDYRELFSSTVGSVEVP